MRPSRLATLQGLGLLLAFASAPAAGCTPSPSSNSGGGGAGGASVSSGGASSWSDCSMGLDPALKGGDLLRAWTRDIGSTLATCPGRAQHLDVLALGPTGDVAVGVQCPLVGPETSAHYDRFNGSGVIVDTRNHFPVCCGAGLKYGWHALAIDPDNNLFTVAIGYENCPPPSGNYCSVETVEEVAPGGQAVSPSCHAYRTQALTSAQDLGCGPVTPISPSGGVIVHVDPSCTCVFSRALPVVASVDWREGTGAVLYVTSTTPLDLGCGTLAAAAGGSTLVTRLDLAGQCVFGASVAVPNLTAALDLAGQVVLSGLAGAGPVDLGGGPLAPLGGEDLVLAELDASGHHVWSRRLGAPGVTFTSPRVTVSAAGDVYLQTGFQGGVDLGGGAVTANAADTVVASYSSAGAHRWSRDFPITGEYLAGVDGCGSLVVASIDDQNFDAGYGKLGPTPPPKDPWYVAVVRFAP